jgi:hypothetical protein
MTKERLMMTRPVWWQNELYQTNSVGANLLIDDSGQIDSYKDDSHPVLDAINQTISGDMSTYLHLVNSVASSNYKFRTEQSNYKDSFYYTDSETIFVDVHMSGRTISVNGSYTLTPYEGDNVSLSSDKIIRLKGRKDGKFIRTKYDYFSVSSSTEAKIYAIEIYGSGDTLVQNGVNNPTATDKYYYPSSVTMTTDALGSFELDWIDDNYQPAWAFGAPKLAYSPTDLSANDEWIGPEANVRNITHLIESEGEPWSFTKYPTTAYPTANDPTSSLVLNFDLSSETTIDDIDPISRMTMGINIQPSSIAANPDQFEIIVENNIGDTIGYGIGGICSGDAWETHNVEIGTLGTAGTFGDFKYAKMFIKNVPAGAKMSTAEFYMEMGKGSSGSGVMGGGGGGNVDSAITPLILGGAVNSPSGARCRKFVDWGNGANHHRGNLNLTNEFNVGYYTFGENDEGMPQYINPTTGSVMGVVRNITSNSAENSIRNNYYRDGMIEGGGWTSYRNAARIKTTQLIDFDSGFDLPGDFTVFIHSQAYNPSNVYSPEENGTIFFRGTETEPELEVYFSNDELIATHYDQNGEPVTKRSTVDDSQTMIGVTFKEGSNGSGVLELWTSNGYTNLLSRGTSRSFKPLKLSGAKSFIGGFKNNYSEGDNYNGWIHELGVVSGVAWQQSNWDTFNESRFYNYEYLNASGEVYPDVSGVNWIVPEMSGEACWTTKYLPEDIKGLSPPIYEVKNETNPNLIPNTVTMSMTVDCHTDHPSGLNIKPQVVFVRDNGNYAVFDLFINVPSGSDQDVTAVPTKFVNVNPILISDIDHDYIDLETEFVYTSGLFRGDITIRNAELCIDTLEVEPTGIANMPLYVKGLFGQGSDLFIKNLTTPGNTDLFMEGYSTYNSGVDMFLNASVSGDIMSLYIEGLQPGSGVEYATLYINSTTDPSTGKITNLSIPSVLDPTYSIDLFIDGGTGDITSNMDLVINPLGGAPYSTVPLTLFNNNSGINVNVDMFVKTKTGTAYNENVNLFINREFEGIKGHSELFIQSPSGTSDSIKLSIDGVNKLNNTFNMMTSGQHTPSGNMIAYVHGF